MKLVTVEEMRNIEQESDASGHTYENMMEHAGTGLAEEVRELRTQFRDPSALGLVGSGNNGGDTLVALAHLAETYSWEVCAYIVKARPAEDPLIDRFRKAGGEIVEASDDNRHRKLGDLLAEYAVILDGILGTGVKLPLKGQIQKVLAKTKRELNTMEDPPFVIAVDCPSGVDCDQGGAADECLPADVTVTMAAVKMGMLRQPAFNLLGQLRVVEIGLAEDLTSWRDVRRQVVDGSFVRKTLPARPSDAHKGTFGTAMVIGGSVNYTGAALLAGKAAYRVGAGLVTMAVPTPLHLALSGHFPEAVWLLLPHEVGVIASKAADVVAKNLRRVTAIAVGPGFGLEDTTKEFLNLLIGGTMRAGRLGIGFVQNKEKLDEMAKVTLPPLVIDADGLKLLARLQNWPERIPAPAVLTPHPGEMAILSGLDIDEIQSDRVSVAERFAAQWKHVVVLKGACTVVASPEGDTAVVPVSTAALARAGTGDVLTGLIVGLLAQGVAAYPAAIAGAWLHAQAGVLAEVVLGNSASVLAGDVLDAVPDILSDLS